MIHIAYCMIFIHIAYCMILIHNKILHGENYFYLNIYIYIYFFFLSIRIKLECIGDTHVSYDHMNCIESFHLCLSFNS